MNTPILLESEIISRIYFLRGYKVMLAQDLAAVYGVETKRLNEQVKRNLSRFPTDFMFRLTEAEWLNLRSQFATASFGMVRTAPYAFTEHGAVMLASVLKSEQAVKASIQVVRAFVHLRSVLSRHQELAQKLAELEEKVDDQFKIVFDALHALLSSPDPPREHIGFRPGTCKN